MSSLPKAAPRASGAVARAPGGELAWLAPAGLAALAVVVVGLLDLYPVSALDDDWGYTWSIQQLVAGHGLRWFPTDSAIHLVQTLYSTAITLGHPDPRSLRLSVLPFLALSAFFVYLLARRFGASRFWSAAAPAALLSTPVLLAVATGFMTDVFYLALMLGTVYFGLRWADGTAPPWACAAFAMLAAFQRQHGVLLVPFVVAVLLLAWRRRGLRPADLAAAALILAVDGVTLILPYTLNTATLAMRDRTAAVQALSRHQLLTPFLVAPTMVGWFALPFLFAISPRRLLASRWGVLATVLLTALTFLLVRESVVEQANWYVKWGVGGVGPRTIGSAVHVFGFMQLYFKAFNWGMPLLLGLFLWQARPWIFEKLPVEAGLLLLVALSQMAPMAETGSLDRYWIPVVAPLLPLLALHASRFGIAQLPKVMAVVVAAGNLAVFTAMEQEYLAWQVAGERTAQRVYQGVPPLQVGAEYEVNVVYGIAPYFERTGRLPVRQPGQDPLTDIIQYMEFGPADPRLRLCFAAADDPRPGQAYRSLYSGKIIFTAGGC